MEFGGTFFVGGLIVFLIFNADNFVVGAVIGSTGLGLYAIAFNWGSMICGRLYEVVHTVLFPTFSRMQDNRNKLKESYLRVLEYITFIGVISNLTLLLCSRDFLFYVLGRGTDKWMPALIAFQIILIYGVIRTFLEPIANVILALGESRLLLKSNVFVGVFELSLLYPVTKYFGIEGVAALVTLCYSMQYFIYFPFLKKRVNFRYSDIWSFMKPTIASALFMIAIAYVAKGLMNASLLSFVLRMLLCVMGYGLFYNVITRWKLVREMASMVGSMRIRTL